MSPHQNDMRPKLLVAEDHSLLRTAVADLLEYDFDVLASVDNGRLAVEAAVALMPDIVILDVSMPMVDGLEVAMRLKARSCKSKVIFLGASADPLQVEACLAAGGDGFVLKTRVGTDLVYAINEALADRLFFDVSRDYAGAMN